jgi:ADP-ribosylglycohydrolase
MVRSRLHGKISGAIIGGAIGDAFGIRTEMMHYLDIEEQYGKITHFEQLPPRKSSERSLLERFHPFGRRLAVPPGSFHPAGRWSHEVGGYTDDTRYRLLVVRAILRKGGPVNGRELAEEFLNYRLLAEGVGEPPDTYSWPEGPELSYARSIASLESLADMAAKQRGCDPGWDAPIGLACAGDPEQAAVYGDAMSVAVASAFLPGATIGQIIENVLRYTGDMGIRYSGFRPRVERAVELAEQCADMDAYRELFYKEILVTFPPYENFFALEVIPCALALCVLAKGDPAAAIIGAANLGRDCDTSAAMAGELMGALHGLDAFPPDWVFKVLKANPAPDLTEIADRLSDLVTENNREKQKRAGQILSLA